jgi:Rad3-related DNA helicase
MESLEKYFPFSSIREKQKRSLDFIAKAYELGYRDIIISAPTGTGKTGIGACVCHWANTNLPSMSPTGENLTHGGYYLTSQKMLQAQIERDFVRMKGTSASIKSAMSYHCLSHDRPCGLKSKSSPCNNSECPYKTAKTLWQSAILSVTNYAYFFTAGQYTDDISQRQVLVCDECHNLEREIIRYVDIVINEELFDRWTPGIHNLPEIKNIQEFAQWIKSEYLPEANARYTALIDIDDDSQAETTLELKQHIDKIQHGIDLISANSNDWIFWKEIGKSEKSSYIARPVEASPFSNDMLFKRANLRIYMSAYPGEKQVFCRSIGLNLDEVAMASFGSTFPVKNRPIIFYGCGSMSMRNVDSSAQKLSYVVRRLFDIHKLEKGVIHCHSYKMSRLIREALSGTEHEHRLIYHEDALGRDEAYQAHVSSREPTVLISPSMSEGFDFAGDLARWQLIVKCPYPMLGDKQVAVKKSRDEEWYVQQAVSSIIQACGRIVRSETDTGKTYILDSDFLSLFKRYEYMFPHWWKIAFIDATKASDNNSK